MKYNKDLRKIWLLAFPTYQYEEDVKQLAAKAGLKIIDAKFSDLIADEFVESKTPKLTKVKVKVKAKPVQNTD